MKWHIYVAGYGGFDFEGTHEEALAMRAHKARWERGIAYLWSVDDDGRITRVWPAHDRLGCWNLPPSGDHGGAQYEILAAEIAEAMLTGAEKEDVEHEQHYRGLSREWWLNFWDGWLMEETRAVGAACDTGALAREIYDARSAKA